MLQEAADSSSFPLSGSYKTLNGGNITFYNITMYIVYCITFIIFRKCEPQTNQGQENAAGEQVTKATLLRKRNRSNVFFPIILGSILGPTFGSTFGALGIPTMISKWVQNLNL